VPLKIQINSKKTRIWKEKSVEDVVTIGPRAQATLVPTKIEICNSQDVESWANMVSDNIDPDLLWNLPACVNTKFNHVRSEFISSGYITFKAIDSMLRTGPPPSTTWASLVVSLITIYGSKVCMGITHLFGENDI